MWKKHGEKLGFILLFFVLVTTRFVFLGYSDYIGDEHKAFYQPEEGQTTRDFFMSRRKGPMQFIVSHIPYLITGDFHHELAQRIPFSLVSVSAVIVFYFFMKELSGKVLIAWLSAFLLSINGFIVGFGRIAQYQNLNLLFSFAALLFYAKFFKGKNRLKNSLLGTAMWCFSFLSHWDAIFILPVVCLLFGQYVFSNEVVSKDKIKLLGLNFVLGSLLLLPFLIPYTQYQLADTENTEYFNRRVSAGESDLARYLELYELYNPFISIYFVTFFAIVGLFLVRRTYFYSSWFIFTFLMFAIFIRKPGTHIYNFVIPAIILASFGIEYVCSKLKNAPKVLFSLLVLLIVGILTFQTYSIFIDHREEYPWSQKVYYDFEKIEDWYYDKKKVKTRDRVYHKLETPKFTYDQKLPLFGFPHRRNWDEIRDFIKSENEKNNEDLGYFSNEVKTITEWYMDVKYQADDAYYTVGIKNPLSFVNDWKFTNIKGKTTVKEIENEYGETVVRIYRVEPKD